MKYIKLYENFDKYNINSYDWEYLFQDFVDDYNLNVKPYGLKPMIIGEKMFFIFWLMKHEDVRRINKLSYYSSINYNNEQMLKFFESCYALEQSIKRLITTYESLGGQVFIHKGEGENLPLEIGLSIDKMDIFKKQ